MQLRRGESESAGAYGVRVAMTWLGRFLFGYGARYENYGRVYLLKCYVCADACRWSSQGGALTLLLLVYCE